MNPHDLIRIARHLASGAVGGIRGRPRQAELRRAVSAAYYALSYPQDVVGQMLHPQSHVCYSAEIQIADSICNGESMSRIDY